MLLYKYIISKHSLDNWKENNSQVFFLEKAKRNARLVSEKKAKSIGADASKIVIKESNNSKGSLVLLCEIE